jgi:hypothetical protein
MAFFRCKSAGTIKRRAAYYIVPRIGAEKVKETTAVLRVIECRQAMNHKVWTPSFIDRCVGIVTLAGETCAK